MDAATADTSGRDLLAKAGSFADLIRARMGPMPQWQVAEQIGVSQSRVSRWLSGGAPKEPDKIALVAAWLGVTSSELDDFLRTTHYERPRRTAAERITLLEHTLAELHREVHSLTRRLEEANVIAPLNGARRRRRSGSGAPR